MVTEVARVHPDGAGRVVAVREGTFGDFGAEVATPLALVLTELVQNAVEHGFAGTGGARDRPTASGCPVSCGSSSRTTGAGCPSPSTLDTSASLGLQIARTLLEGAATGRSRWARGEHGGTRAEIGVPLSR